MSESFFALLLILLSVGYGFKYKITTFINKNILKNSNFKIKSTYISYFIFALLVITLILGMMLGEKTKKKYANVSNGFEKARPKSSNNKPNPLFDIDTYW